MNTVDEITDAEIDAGGRALREFKQGGRILRDWATLPKYTKQKWLRLSELVLRAARNAKLEGR